MSCQQITSGYSAKALQKELKELIKNPMEGFCVKLLNDDNLYDWIVTIFGPPQTIYEGGYFKAILRFPQDYPYSPPSLKFVQKMFHPNIYEDGDVCISILHSPGEDKRSGELASERWNPTQNVRTVLLSVISLLNEPNINSAANVDASVAYRKWKESGGANGDYEDIVRKTVTQTQLDAIREGVRVPLTLEEYCSTGTAQGESLLVEEEDFFEYMNDDYDDDVDSDIDEDEFEDD